MSASRTTGARHRAREIAFKVAYQCDLTHDAWSDAWASHRAQHELTADQVGLIEDIVQVLARRGDEVDALLREAAERWPLERLAATDRAVLRTAIAELIGRPGTPAPVVLDEAIEIARRYGSDESGGFVNGVLDRLARQLRPGEL